MRFKTLYAGGCSLTYGSEALGDWNIGPENLPYSYPAVIGELNDMIVVNEAKGGSSNENIARRLREYILSHQQSIHETLFIIGMTHPIRSTVHHSGLWWDLNSAFSIDENVGDSNQFLNRVKEEFPIPVQSMWRALSSLRHEHTWMQDRYTNQILSIVSILELYDASYCIFNSGFYSTDESVAAIQNRLSGVGLDLTSLMMLDWLSDNGYRFRKGFHPDADGYRAWAEFLNKTLRSRGILG